MHLNARDRTMRAIPAVVNGMDAPVPRVKDGLEAVEEPVPMPDAGLPFTDNKAERIVRIVSNGSTSVWVELTDGANAPSAISPGGSSPWPCLSSKPAAGPAS